jgi:hypothetical protein
VTQPADRRRILALMAAAPLALPVASAARAADAPAAPAGLSEEERRRLTDFPWLARYADDNARVLAAGKPVTLVFMGDSITQGWPDKRPAFFAQGGRVGRGIGGQTTPQMVLRMMADVIALRPRAVHIMAGTNDIAGNTGPMTAQQTHDNLAAMATLAKATASSCSPPSRRPPAIPGAPASTR